VLYAEAPLSKNTKAKKTNVHTKAGIQPDGPLFRIVKDYGVQGGQKRGGKGGREKPAWGSVGNRWTAFGEDVWEKGRDWYGLKGWGTGKGGGLRKRVSCILFPGRSIGSGNMSERRP